VSDGDGGTLQLQLRQVDKGVNAADGNSCITSLCHYLTSLFKINEELRIYVKNILKSFFYVLYEINYTR